MGDRVKASVELFTQRLSLIRALYVVSVANNGPREEVHAEFYHAVGDVLEGVALDDLQLTYIDKNKIKDEAAWLRDK